MNQINVCCADCGVEGGASLKVCKSCMLVRYCNADCQRNNWPKHKKECKRRAAELRDESLFKDPPAKEECPICFLPMPVKLICCVSLPPAAISSIPVYDFAVANEKLTKMGTEQYSSCCGKNICLGCLLSFLQSGNERKCPFCKAEIKIKTEVEQVEDLMKRVDVNDAGAIYVLGSNYFHGKLGLQQDLAKGVELWTQAAKLGSSDAHFSLGNIYDKRGDLKKAKFHYEAAAMAGHEVARCNIGVIEAQSENMERAVKHFRIAASAGSHLAMNNMLVAFKRGHVSRDAIDSTLAAYNNSCAEMRSEARDAYINIVHGEQLI